MAQKSGAKTPEPPRVFTGNQRTMMMVVHAALTRAGYKPSYFTGDTRQQLAITANQATGAIEVCNVTPTRGRKYAAAKADAEQCATAINKTLGAIAGSASSLASSRFDSGGGFSAGPWHDIVVKIPGPLTLRRLRSRLVVT